MNLPLSIRLKPAIEKIQSISFLFLPAFLVLAVLIRLGALWSLKNSVYFHFFMVDERVYHTWALKIVNGSLDTSSVYEFAPLFPYLIAMIYKLFGQDILFVRFLNILLGTGTCFIIYLTGKKIADQAIGLLAFLIAALYGPFILYSIVPLKAALSTFLFAIVVYLLIVTLSRVTLGRIVCLGVVIGLLWMVRPQMMILIPFLPLAILWYQFKNGAALKIYALIILGFTTGLFLSVSPFAIRNYRVAGELTLMNSQAGFNLYKSNYPDSPKPAAFAFSSPFFQGIQYTIEASRRTGITMTPSQASDYWTVQTLQCARKQPETFLKNIGKKALIFCRQFQLSDQYCYGFISRHVQFLKFPFFSFILIFPLGVAGMLMNSTISRKDFILGILFCLYALTMIIFFTRTRYRVPIMVILIPYAVIGMNLCLSYISQKKWGHLICYCLLVFVFVLPNYLPVQPNDDITAYLNFHAIASKDSGLRYQAITSWEASSRLDGLYSDSANLSLAAIYFKNRDYKRGWEYLDRISDTSFIAAKKRTIQGDLMMRIPDLKQAAKYYKKSLAINSGQLITRQKLIAVLKRTNPIEAEQEEKKLGYIASFYGEYAKLFLTGQ